MNKICLYCCTEDERKKYEEEVIEELFDSDEELYIEEGDSIDREFLIVNNKIIKVRNNMYDPKHYDWASVYIDIEDNELRMDVRYGCKRLAYSTKKINYCPMCGRKLNGAQD